MNTMELLRAPTCALVRPCQNKKTIASRATTIFLIFSPSNYDEQAEREWLREKLFTTETHRGTEKALK
jgi:hypothetical protein